MFMGCIWIITSIGASGAVNTSCPEEPRWIDNTVSQSTNASQSGSQWSVWKLGSPSGTGFSVKVMEWQPSSATRRTSAAHSSGDQIMGSAIGMNLSG